MKNLFKSLAAFQQECPIIHKATSGYGYTYADLPDIFKVINPLLAKHGLGFTQEIDGDALVTTIFHVESGEIRVSRANLIQGVQLKGMNEFQVFGSNLTYMRRYCISAALCLVTDKDIDASGEQKTAPKAPVKQEKVEVVVKPVLMAGTPEFAKACKYVAGGGDITKVTDKYEVSNGIYGALKNAIK